MSAPRGAPGSQPHRSSTSAHRGAPGSQPHRVFRVHTPRGPRVPAAQGLQSPHPMGPQGPSHAGLPCPHPTGPWGPSWRAPVFATFRPGPRSSRSAPTLTAHPSPCSRRHGCTRGHFQEVPVFQQILREVPRARTRAWFTGPGATVMLRLLPEAGTGAAPKPGSEQVPGNGLTDGGWSGWRPERGPCAPPS